MLFAQGRNAKQVQRWLGHHSAAFTLDTYIHLLSDDLDEPLELPPGTASPLIGAVGAHRAIMSDPDLVAGVQASEVKRSW